MVLLAFRSMSVNAYRNAFVASTVALCFVAVALSGCKRSRSKPEDHTVSMPGTGVAVPSNVASVFSINSANSDILDTQDAPIADDQSYKTNAAVDASSDATTTALSSSVHDVSHDLSTPELELGNNVTVTFANNMLVAKTKDDSLVLSKCDTAHCGVLNSDGQAMSRWPVAVTYSTSSAPPAARAKQFAYWISQNRLVRRQVRTDATQGPLEVVVSDAANVALVSAARAVTKDANDVVLYVARKPLHSPDTKDSQQWEARLWVEGHGSRPLTQEAASVSSMALVHLGLGRFAVLTLDGRLGMTPLHARYVELDATGAPYVGPDQVVYVAGSAETAIALDGVLVGKGPVGVLPIYKNARQYGLLVLRIGYASADGQQATATWVDYPNGLDPAPVVAAHVCGKPMVAFVRPAGVEPESSRVLEIGTIVAKNDYVQVEQRRMMAVWERITHVSFGGDDAGGWLVYTTEQGLRARRVNCVISGKSAPKETK